MAKNELAEITPVAVIQPTQKGDELTPPGPSVIAHGDERHISYRFRLVRIKAANFEQGPAKGFLTHLIRANKEKPEDPINPMVMPAQLQTIKGYDVTVEETYEMLDPDQVEGSKDKIFEFPGKGIGFYQTFREAKIVTGKVITAVGDEVEKETNVIPFDSEDDTEPVVEAIIMEEPSPLKLAS